LAVLLLFTTLPGDRQLITTTPGDADFLYTLDRLVAHPVPQRSASQDVLDADYLQIREEA
jgi:hypothetical protein